LEISKAIVLYVSISHSTINIFAIRDSEKKKKEKTHKKNLH
jgi:hypothetical protein